MYLNALGAVPTAGTPDLSPKIAAASTPQPDATPPAAGDPAPTGRQADGAGSQEAGTHRITMSHGGRILSKSADSGKDAVTQAIEDSKYPDEIKKLMIKIRELQQQLREKAAELQEAAADQSLPARQREAKVAAIRDAVGTITSAIQSATATLNDTMTVMRLSSDDRKAIATMISGAA